MSNPWFRIYTEFEDDPKVQMLSEVLQRRLIMLFCERGKEEIRTDPQRAFKWNISLAELADTKKVFLENEFIDERWNVTNWNKRQFISDSSTNRVRRHRQAMKQGETLRNVSVTAPDTDTDTEADTEQKQKQKKKPSARSVPPEELAGTLPLVGDGLYQVSKSQVREWSEAYPGVDVKVELRKLKIWLDANPTRRKTPKGICRAIVNWLNHAQDRSPAHQTAGGNGNGNGNGTRPTIVETQAAELRRSIYGDNPTRASDQECSVAAGNYDGKNTTSRDTRRLG